MGMRAAPLSSGCELRLLPPQMRKDERWERAGWYALHVAALCLGLLAAKHLPRGLAR